MRVSVPGPSARRDRGRWALLAAILLVVPAARFECRIGSSLVGADGPLPVRQVAVTPSRVSLPVGGLASLEGLAIDELGGRLEVQLLWVSLDPTVASVAPRRGTHTVVEGRAAGRTDVVAVHRLSGAADTVEVAVSAP